MKTYLEERIEWYDDNYRNGNAQKLRLSENPSLALKNPEAILWEIFGLWLGAYNSPLT